MKMIASVLVLFFATIAWADSNQTPSATYAGTGSYTCKGKSQGCTVIEQGTQQNNAVSLERYRRESDSAQARIEALRNVEEQRRRYAQ